MKGLTLTTKEQSRIQVLNGVMEGKVRVSKAAGLMGVSERHSWRLLAAYRKDGATAIAHGSRWRSWPRGPAGFNNTHLSLNHSIHRG